MGAILKSAILNRSQFFKWKGGRLIYQITSAFSAKVIPVNKFEAAVMIQKLQHILLQVTEDSFDHEGECLISKFREIGTVVDSVSPQ